MKLRYILTVIIVLSICVVNAQTINNGTMSKYALPDIPNLKIGDQVPDFEIKKIINSEKSNARIADFKDQLLIIDFWSVACKGCVEALPKMDALQKQFGNKLKILPVTYEGEALVNAFWKRNSYTKSLSLPSVVEDRMFLSYFRYNVFPHEVWIYKGKVIAITQPEYVDANNIQKVLNGERIDWPVKNDFYVFDPYKEGLFKPDPNQIDPNTFMKYAAISDYKEGVQETEGIVRDPVKKTVRAYHVNNSIYSIYKLNWNHVVKLADLVIPDLDLGPNEIIWEVGDQSRYISKEGTGYREEWLRKYGICFESLNPDTGQNDQQVAKTIISDLDALLGLHVRWEKRKEKVLVLIRTNNIDKLKSKKTIEFDEKSRAWTTKKYIHKGNIYQYRDSKLPIAYEMNQQENNPYVFDETGYKDKVDMDLNIPSWTDIAAIRKAIAPYGLNLKEEERMVDKLVFTEIDGGLLVKK